MTEDKTLVVRAKAGDFGAFDELVTRYERLVFSIAMSILRRREDAEDAVQSAFFSALENLAGLRDDSGFAPWIKRIAVNASLKELNKRTAQKTVPIDENTAQEESGEIAYPERVEEWPDELEKVLAHEELKRILDREVESLPEKYRLVFVLRDVQELSTKETAAALGITEAAVKVRLLRARLALREKLTAVFGNKNSVTADGHRHVDKKVTLAEDLIKSYGAKLEVPK